MTSLKIRMLEYLTAEGCAESTKQSYGRTFNKLQYQAGQLQNRGNEFWVHYLAGIKDPVYRNSIRSVILKVCRDVLGEQLNLPPVKVPIRRYDAYTIDQVKHIFSFITNPKHLAIAKLLYIEGFRVNEITGIRLRDCSKADGAVIIRDTKNNSDYKKFLDVTTIQAIRHYVKSCKAKPVTWLFEGPHHSKYTSGSIQQFMGNAIYLAGLPKLGGTTRPFRRSNATWKIENGWTANHIAASLNNTERTVNRYYALVRPEYLNDLKKPTV